MAAITLITGSTLGGAEYVADHLADLLSEAGHTTTIINQADLSALDPDQIWLLICSTHGAGEFPDNIQPFVSQLQTQQPDLTPLRYGLVAIGDSSYDTFCQAGKDLDHLLAGQGAKRLGERLEIDVSQDPVPEDPAEIWLNSWQNLL
ncbi:FMN-binding protein MioC [Photobacterium sp. CCB-ST2H9]|uniref:FMN-binding protein MioC n=1 Tax=unclassified Photobacterium TaxID=2628852 RepID=UPI00200495ED|nr:FMN-binding protein MioC [Photobacterium sp. CCB-ST2H9]UTM57321.1 FMN-binding protein MioC [Photobacterium sp. CCB-ST2H9]